MSTRKHFSNREITNKFNDASYADNIVKMRNVQLGYVRQAYAGETTSTGEIAQEGQVIICERDEQFNEGFTYCMDLDEFARTSARWGRDELPTQGQWGLIDKTMKEGFDTRLNTLLMTRHDREKTEYTKFLVECDPRDVLIDPDGPYQLDAPTNWGTRKPWSVNNIVTVEKADGEQIRGVAIVKSEDGCFPARKGFPAGYQPA